MLKRNLVANYVGQGWVALMGFALVPAYVHYLGIESYGLMGLFALLTTWLGLLDMGMAPTLTREMARYLAGEYSSNSVRVLLRTVEFTVVCMALLVSAGVGAIAPWIAGSWLQADSLPIQTVSQAVSLMGLVTGLRLLEGVYRSSLVGLGLQVDLNIVNSVAATLRGLGGLAVLAFISRTLFAFFAWQAVASVLTLIGLSLATYRTLPIPTLPIRYSPSALRSIRTFAGGMVGISMLSILLTQVDKLILSRMLSLSDYGYYTLASVVAGALSVFVGPIRQALYPRLCELHAKGDEAGFAVMYHKGSQLVTVVAGSAAAVLVVFAEEFLNLWTQDQVLATRVAPLLRMLVVGSFLNGLMGMPYQAQLAHGWTSLTVRINFVAVAAVVPAILWATHRYGAYGAAGVWVALNAAYILVGMHFMFRRILSREKRSWFISDTLFPLLAGTTPLFLLKAIVGTTTGPLWEFLLLISAATLALSASSWTAPHVRIQIRGLYRRAHARGTTT